MSWMLTPRTWAALCEQRDSSHCFPQWNHPGDRHWEAHPSLPVTQQQVWGISIIWGCKLIGFLQTGACCRGCRMQRSLERHGRFRTGFAKPLFPRPSNHMLGSVGELQVSDPWRAQQIFAPKGWQLSEPEPSWSRAAERGRMGCSSPGNRSMVGSLPNRLLPIKVLHHWIEAADELIVPFPWHSAAAWTY